VGGDESSTFEFIGEEGDGEESIFNLNI